MSTKLPPELVSLIHHVELNKAGWWDKAIQRLIVAAIWLVDNPPTLQSLPADLYAAFQLDIDPGKVKSQVEELFSAGTLIELSGGTLKITESARKLFLQDISAAQAAEEAAQRKFADLLRTHCPSLDATATWRDFDGNLLMPLIGETGANTFHLLSGSGLQVSSPKINQFLSSTVLDLSFI